MKKLSIAIVSDVPPDSAYTAGQVLAKIMENTDSVQFIFYWLNQSHLPNTKNFPDNCHYAGMHLFDSHDMYKKIKHFITKLTCRIPKLRGFIKVIFATLPLIYTGLKIGLKLRKNNVAAVWLVLQGEKLAITYYIINIIVNKKVILHQWDPITWWLAHKNYNHSITNIITKLVNKLEREVSLNLVPSTAWSEHLKRQNKNVLKIDNFITMQELSELPLIRVGAKDNFNAVFIGQFYANQELIEIIETLSQNLNRQNKVLNIHYFGSGVPNIDFHGVRIYTHGYIDRNILISRISKWDAALLPYPQEKRFADASKFSFPSKSRIYLAAGLPILSNCALDSSPHIFYTNFYGDYYHNIRSNKNIEYFINKTCNRSLQVTKLRQEKCKEVIKNHFSDVVELMPLQEYWGAKI